MAEVTTENTTKKVTAITLMKTGEGDRISFTYSKLSPDGKIIESNSRGEPFVTVGADDEAVVKAVYDLVARRLA